MTLRPVTFLGSFFLFLYFRARDKKQKETKESRGHEPRQEMKHLYLVHEMLLQKSKPFPVNSLVYSFVPAFHCSTRYHGKTDLILVISWSWDGNVSSLSSRARSSMKYKLWPRKERQNHGTNLDMQLQEYLLSWGPGSWYMFNHAVPRTCTSRKILLVLHVLIQQYLWLRDMLPRVSPTWGTGTLGIMSLSHMYLYLTCNTWYIFS